MFKIFKSKKKSKKDKEALTNQQQQQQTQSQENPTNKSISNGVGDNKENHQSPKHDSQKSLKSPTHHPSVLHNINDNITGVTSTPLPKAAAAAIETHLSVDVQCSQEDILAATHSCQPSPSVFTDSCCHHTDYNSPAHMRQQQLNVQRESQMSSALSGADLNRILTSGYLTGDDDLGYLRRGVDLKSPKSPHFHRPSNFSYRNQPIYSSCSSSKSSSKKGTLASQLLSSSTVVVKKVRHSRSNSPNSEEAIRLSKYSGGYIPDPATPKKIESLDWPSPPYAAAVPELRTRSRSSSNRNREESPSPSSLASSRAAHRKLFDNEHDDYLMRFKRYRSQGDSAIEDEEVSVEELIQRDPKLKREFEELVKLENKSGIARLLSHDLKKRDRKCLTKDFSIDPWKASRVPNADYELPIKTRFDSPVNASPSRVLLTTRSSNLSRCSYDEGLAMSSQLTGHTSTPLTNTATAISNSSTSTAVVPQSDGLLQTLHVQQQKQKSSTLATSKPPASNIVYNMAVPRPGYGLSTPKSVTLPNSSRYTGLSTHRSIDFDSSGIAAGSSYSSQNTASGMTDEKRKILTQSTYNNYSLISHTDHGTRSTPNLLGIPKIYSYNELKLGYKKKLPADVDRQRLERHLASNDLMKLFGVMTVEQFYEMPEWKRVDLKKRARLF